MRPRAGLELRQEVADVRLRGLRGEEEDPADLAVHEPLRDEREDLDLPGGRLLLELLERGRERDDFGASGLAPRGRLGEAARVVGVAAQDLVALSSVHDLAIGLEWGPL